VTPNRQYEVVIVLSGPEPQRSILEGRLLREWQGRAEQVLLVRGLMKEPQTTMRRQNVTLMPYLGDEALAEALLGAGTIIARSGYSTIMDLAALNVMNKATLIPTPGQPEQEYLAMATIR
jgi:predicted glycosyltransferase